VGMITQGPDDCQPQTAGETDVITVAAVQIRDNRWARFGTHRYRHREFFHVKMVEEVADYALSERWTRSFPIHLFDLFDQAWSKLRAYIHRGGVQ
jgi:hypothetical protein